MGLSESVFGIPAEKALNYISLSYTSGPRRTCLSLVRHKWLFIALFLLEAMHYTPRAEAAARVTVTIDSVNNRACVDQFIFCGKPDMMVRVSLRESDGTRINCPDTTPIANRDNIGPLPSCASELVTLPVELIVTVFDTNENLLPGTVAIQSEILLSPNGSGAILPEFRMNGRPQVISGPQANITLTATITSVAPAFSASTLQLSRSSIDPALGDRTIASSGPFVTAETPPLQYPEGVRVGFSVQSPAGVIHELAEGVFPATGFHLDWDGRINGQVVPSGIYELRATLGGKVISAPVTVTSIPNVFEIERASPDPWNSRAGPVFFAYRLSPRGTITRRVEGPSAAGSACTLGPQPVLVPDTTTGTLGGNGTVSVPVTTPAGRFLPPGNYCVRFRANDVTGTLISARSLEVNVGNPPPLHLVATLNPAVPWILPTTTAPDAGGTQVPVPAGPVFVEVRAFDDQGNPRPTGRITVRAMPFLTIPIPTSFITTTTCTGVIVCRMQISGATLTRATDVIFDADGGDLPSASPADPPPVSTSVPQRAAALVWAPQARAGPVSVPVSGSPAMGFTTVPRNRTQDVAFHAGTGLDLTVPSQATQLSDGIARILEVFFGGDSNVGPNSITEDQGRSIAFWLTRTPAIVETGADNPDIPGWPLCRRTKLESVSFADMQAVIHNVNCRDNADWNGATFSAEFGAGLGYVAWHEFHHAAYELADEYPGGAHYQTRDLPNNMSSATECARWGAEPALCTQIGTTGWWRAATMPDVMIGNTRQNADDKRRATMIQNICSTGGC